MCWVDQKEREKKKKKKKEKKKKMARPHCCPNPPVLNPSSGQGNVEELGGLKAYISASPNSKLAILLVTDAFGNYSNIIFIEKKKKSNVTPELIKPRTIILGLFTCDGLDLCYRL